MKGSELLTGSISTGFVFGLDPKTKFMIFMDYMNEGHIIVFGPSGTGKTSALLIPTLRAWQGPFFAIDISGDISANVHVDSRMLISPTQPKKSAIYYIFSAVDHAETNAAKERELKKLARAIVDMPPKAEKAEKYYHESAIDLLYASLVAFYYYTDSFDFIDICQLVFFSSVKQLFEKIEATGNEVAIGYIASMKDEVEENISGVKSTLNAKIASFAENENLAAIIRRPLEIIDEDTPKEEVFYPAVLEEKKVFLVIPDNEQEEYNAFMRVATSQTLEYISKRKYNKKTMKRIFVAIDEFASLGRLKLLGPFRKFRKNGANLCVLTQSLVDIDLTYNKDERKAILDNCKYTVVLGAKDTDTATYFSNLVGKEEKESISTTSSQNGKSTTTSIKEEYAIRPDEWSKLNSEENDELIVIHPSGYMRLDKAYYFKDDAAKGIISDSVFDDEDENE